MYDPNAKLMKSGNATCMFLARMNSLSVGKLSMDVQK